MNNWFYAHGGEQKGPVSVEELSRLAASGQFLPQQDLVWREGMGDWKKASEVPELSLTPTQQPVKNTPAGARANSSDDPYQPPSASPVLTSASLEDDLPEIEPGSSPLGITECISRAFDLTKRYFGIVLAVWAINFGINFAIGAVFGFAEVAVQAASGMSSAGTGGSYPDMESTQSVGLLIFKAITQVITNVVSIFLTLGLARFGLNLISGKPVEISMLFKEGPKLVRSILAALLYGLIVVGGLLLLIVPGIYWALKFSQYQTAIVDKDMGVMDSLRYSSALTHNNKWALLGLGILCGLINIAGMLALCVGLLFTLPLTWLAMLVAYRWLQHGPTALQDRGLLRV